MLAHQPLSDRGVNEVLNPHPPLYAVDANLTMEIGRDTGADRDECLVLHSPPRTSLEDGHCRSPIVGQHPAARRPHHPHGRCGNSAARGCAPMADGNARPACDQVTRGGASSIPGPNVTRRCRRRHETRLAAMCGTYLFPIP